MQQKVGKKKKPYRKKFLRFEPSRLKINLETSWQVIADPDADLVVGSQPEDRSGQAQRIDGKANNPKDL